MAQGPVINLLETYLDIPPNMIVGLQDHLKDTKEGDLKNLDTKLYKLKALKTKLRNCLTNSFSDHIEEWHKQQWQTHLFLIDHLTHLSGKGFTQGDHQKLHHGTKHNKVKFHGILPTRYSETIESIQDD
jgi:hypothetical protein